MSAGPFSLSKYQTDANAIHPIRIQPETEFDDNPAPEAGAGNFPFIKISGSRRAYGIHPRKITLSKTVGDADYDTAKVYAKIVVLTKAAFTDFVIGSTIVYAETDWIVASKTSELIR